jgi:predicted permease
MRPDERELDEEIRGHLALEVQERIARGESPEAARRAALADFGSLMGARASLRDVWRNRPFDRAAELRHDLRVAFRSLMRAKGLSVAVVVTLALGIGANAAMFSVVREVLLRPLVNRDADRLIYIRQGAPGIGAENITFSMPEVRDLRSRVNTVAAFGDFSTVEFNLIGFGEPRVVQAGVVGGSFFEVMGLRPVLGRLLDASDDGPGARGAVVLTHRFWSTVLDGDRGVIGRTIRLGTRTATVVGVLEPSVQYPAETQIIANVVTSPHHLGATMVDDRTHRMTELFGRLAPGVDLEAATAELTTVHAAMMRAHPEAYSRSAGIRVSATRLREQIAAPARTILLGLLAAAGLVFVIACANVANLILARTVRREGELVVRAALGAGTGALRRTLLAESLLLCGAGAALGIVLARPLVTTIGRFASRFSVRALDVSVDASLLWIGAALAMIAAVALAYIPRLPSTGSGAASAGAGASRLVPGVNRRLWTFATVQIALSFVLLSGAGALLASLAALQGTETGFEMRQVLAVDVPLPIEAYGRNATDFVERAMKRIQRLPEVKRVAAGNVVPWRDATRFGAGHSLAVDGYRPLPGDEELHARLRNITPGFFAALDVPIIAGRDFRADDRQGRELVVIVSRSLARHLVERIRPTATEGVSKGSPHDSIPEDAVLDRYLWWTDPYFGPPRQRRIVGVAADVDDQNIVPGAAFTVYHPFRQMPFGDRLFVHASGDPYALVPAVRRIIREISTEQPVERPATFADVRTAALEPERLNAFVLAGFAGVALTIAAVGIAGVLAFSVSARTREFGIRLAIGSTPRRLLVGVLSEGAWIVTIGIGAGALGGYALVRLASRMGGVELPGAAAVAAAAAVLACAAVLASLLPAARASRVDVMQALRSE